LICSPCLYIHPLHALVLAVAEACRILSELEWLARTVLSQQCLSFLIHFLFVKTELQSEATLSRAMSHFAVCAVPPTSHPQRLKFGCSSLCTHVERALELFLPTRFRQTIRDRGPDDSRYPQRPDNPQVTAAMRYIHSQEILEIPEGGTFSFLVFDLQIRSIALEEMCL
jgi:hypothetical protein